MDSWKNREPTSKTAFGEEEATPAVLPARYVFAPELLRRYGLSGEDPLSLKLRARLMERLRQFVQSTACPTQSYAAELFEVSQPRISDLATGKLEKFSLETLLAMCERAEITVVFYVSPCTRGGDSIRCTRGDRSAEVVAPVATESKHDSNGEPSWRAPVLQMHQGQ